jgi:hypothetical protein
MPCILRVEGKDFDVDDYLKNRPFQPSAIFRKGSFKGLIKSAFHITISNSSDPNSKSLEMEIRVFLEKNYSTLTELANVPGVDSLTLDITLIVPSATHLKFSFSSALLKLVGALKMEMEVSALVRNFPS